MEKEYKNYLTYLIREEYYGMAWHGMAWHGMAWLGLAWEIIDVILNKKIENIEHQRLFSAMADCHSF